MISNLTMTDKANQAWDGAPPQWIQELARLATSQGLNGCAKKLGYSSAVISQTISNKYRGDLAKLEEKVRGALMGETVVCPIQGEIGRHTCLEWQSKPKAITNATRIQMYQACRGGCPFSYVKGGKDA